jgi:hypothetical protein
MLATLEHTYSISGWYLVERGLGEWTEEFFNDLRGVLFETARRETHCSTHVDRIEEWIRKLFLRGCMVSPSENTRPNVSGVGGG